MHIQSDPAYMATLFPTNSPLARQISASNAASSTGPFAPPADQVTFSQASRAQAERPFAADKSTSNNTYDFRHISPERLLKEINTLITRGQLSLDETSSLIGILPIALDGGPPPAEYYQPTDFFSLLERSMNFNKYTRNDTAVVYDQMALSALSRLQGTTIEG